MFRFVLFLSLLVHSVDGAVGSRGRAAQIVPTLTTTSSKTSTRTPQRTITSRASFPWLRTPSALNSETAVYTIDATPSGAPSECVLSFVSVQWWWRWRARRPRKLLTLTTPFTP